MDKDVTINPSNSESVSKFIFESVCARFERTIKRMTIIIIIAIILLFASNVVWLYAWMQYDYSSETTEDVELNSDNAPATYIKGEGNEVNNGKGERKDNEDEDPEEEGELSDQKEKVDNE